MADLPLRVSIEKYFAQYLANSNFSVSISYYIYSCYMKISNKDLGLRGQNRLGLQTWLRHLLVVRPWASYPQNIGSFYSHCSDNNTYIRVALRFD